MKTHIPPTPRNRKRPKMIMAKRYAKPKRRSGMSRLLPAERTAHGEHDYELVIEIAAELVVKSINDSDGVTRAFALLDKCQDSLRGRPYSVASIARVAAKLIEGDLVKEAVDRALKIAEFYHKEADRRHGVRLRRGYAASLRFLSKPSKSVTSCVKAITNEDRTDRAFDKLKDFLRALAHGDVPPGIETHTAWIVRPPSDPWCSEMDAFVERIKRGEIPRGHVRYMQGLFKGYHQWLKGKKCAESARSRQKIQI